MLWGVFFKHFQWNKMCLVFFLMLKLTWEIKLRWGWGVPAAPLAPKQVLSLPYLSPVTIFNVLSATVWWNYAIISFLTCNYLNRTCHHLTTRSIPPTGEFVLLINYAPFLGFLSLLQNKQRRWCHFLCVLLCDVAQPRNRTASRSFEELRIILGWFIGAVLFLHMTKLTWS